MWMIIWTINKLVPTGKDSLSIDCFISLGEFDIFFLKLNFTLATGNNENMNFIRLILSQLQPFIIFFIIQAGYKLYRKKKEQFKHQNFKMDIISLCVIISLIVQPHLLQISLEVFK